MKINIACPSAWPWPAPATTKARPAAFTITSSDMRINSRLRRTRSPITPSANKVPARIRPCDIGIDVMSFCLRLRTGFSPEVVRSHERPEQQHRGQFDSDQVWTVQRQADLNGSDLPGRRGPEPRARKDVDNLASQDRRHDRRQEPNCGAEPRGLEPSGARAEVQEHHHKNEHRHHRPGVKYHLERGGEGRAE